MSVHEFYRLKALITLEQVNTTNKTNAPLDTSSVVKTSNVTLTDNETQLFARGLGFCLSPRHIDWTEVNADCDEFARGHLRITEFFHDYTTDNQSDPFYPKSLWTPPTDRDDALNAYLIDVKHDLLTTKHRRIHDNLPKDQRRALRLLKQRHDIVIKSANKGSATVIMDRKWYLDECYRQLNNPTFYEQQDTDITDTIQKRGTEYVKRMLNDELIDKKKNKQTNNTYYIRIPNPDASIFSLKSRKAHSLFQQSPY